MTMHSNVGPWAAMERWIAVILLFASLFVLASIPGAAGLAAAAVTWIVAFAILEHARRPNV